VVGCFKLLDHDLAAFELRGDFCATVASDAIQPEKAIASLRVDASFGQPDIPFERLQRSRAQFRVHHSNRCPEQDNAPYRRGRTTSHD
jgi:hypothetical protein